MDARVEPVEQQLRFNLHDIRAQFRDFVCAAIGQWQFIRGRGCAQLHQHIDSRHVQLFQWRVFACFMRENTVAQIIDDEKALG